MKKQRVMTGIIIPKDDIPENPETLHKDVISGICHQAIEECQIVKRADGITWVTEWWGYKDCVSHWFFIFDNRKRPAIGLCTIVSVDYGTLCPKRLAEKPLYVHPPKPSPYSIESQGKTWL